MSKKFSLILSVALMLTIPCAIAQAPQKEAPKRSIAVTSNRPGTLTIENTTGKKYTFTVYSITGQTVRTIELKNDSTTISLPQGFYLVKSVNGTMKVVVK